MTVFGYARVSHRGSALDRPNRGAQSRGRDHDLPREDQPACALTARNWPSSRAALKPSDVVLVTKLDRLGRSTRELLDLIDRIGKAGP
jgi:DNA invertase Pin-like site-specific DNA recombinase